jgi:hypothetical protein
MKDYKLSNKLKLKIAEQVTGFFFFTANLEKECNSERMGRETKTAACVCLAMGCVANLVASALAFSNGVCICSPIGEHELLFFD